MVDQADKSEADRYEALLDDDAVAEAFAVVDTYAFEGGVRLTLLERR